MVGRAEQAMSKPSDTSASLGVDRQTFLTPVRQALGRISGQAVPPPPTVDPKLVRLASVSEDVVALFAQRAGEVGMTVCRIKSDELIRTVMGLLEKVGARRVAASVGSLPQAVSLNDSLRRKGVEVVDWRATPGFAEQYGLDAGITDVHAALAETGTLICSSDAGHSRGLSLVPPVHVAIVRQSDILPDMVDYWARMKGIPGRELPSSQAFITGPSKTADIEGILITGVHGPGQVHIVVVEGV